MIGTHVGPMARGEAVEDRLCFGVPQFSRKGVVTGIASRLMEALRRESPPCLVGPRPGVALPVAKCGEARPGQVTWPPMPSPRRYGDARRRQVRGIGPVRAAFSDQCLGVSVGRFRVRYGQWA